MNVKLIIGFLALLQSLVEFSQGNDRAKTDPKVWFKDKPQDHSTILRRDVGGVVKLQCKVEPSGAQVRWLKNGKQLILSKLSHFRTTQKRDYKKTDQIYYLLVFNAKPNDSGKYSCLLRPINGTWTTTKIWELHVYVGRYRKSRDAEEYCGYSPVFTESGVNGVCSYSELYHDCKSFPGKPTNVRLTQSLENQQGVWRPAIKVQWEKPDIGFKNLWGYSVFLLGLSGDANHHSCYQINSNRTKPITSVVFNRGHGEPLFGAEYMIMVECLPSNRVNNVKTLITIKGYCQWPQYEAKPGCYAVVNLTAGITAFVNRSFGSWINVTWDQPVQHVGYTSTYVVHLFSYPIQRIFYAVTEVKATQNTAAIRVPPQTECTNVSISVFGKSSKGSETTRARIRLANVGNCPTPAPPPIRKNGSATQRGQSVTVILPSVVMGLLLKFLLYRSKRC